MRKQCTPPVHASEKWMTSLETGECFLMCFLLKVLPPRSVTQPVPPSTPGRGRSLCPMCQPNISCCTTALLVEYLEASWSSWAAQMRVLTPAGSLVTTHPCPDGYHHALGSSAGNSSCYGGGTIFGSLLLGLSCGPWLWEIPPDMGTLALAPCSVLLWVGKGH